MNGNSGGQGKFTSRSLKKTRSRSRDSEDFELTQSGVLQTRSRRPLPPAPVSPSITDSRKVINAAEKKDVNDLDLVNDFRKAKFEDAPTTRIKGMKEHKRSSSLSSIKDEKHTFPKSLPSPKTISKIKMEWKSPIISPKVMGSASPNSHNRSLSSNKDTAFTFKKAIPTGGNRSRKTSEESTGIFGSSKIQRALGSKQGSKIFQFKGADNSGKFTEDESGFLDTASIGSSCLDDDDYDSDVAFNSSEAHHFSWQKNKNNPYADIVQEITRLFEEKYPKTQQSRSDQQRAVPKSDKGHQSMDDIALEKKQPMFYEKKGEKLRSSVLIPVDPPTIDAFRQDCVERYASAYEILTTEETYCASLDKIFNDFVRWLRGFNSCGVKPILKEAEIQGLFGNLNEIYNLHKKLEEHMTDIKEKLPKITKFQTLFADTTVKDVDLTFETGITDLLARYTPFLKIYYIYTSNYNVIVSKLNSERKSNQEFNRFATVFEHIHNLTIESFLIMPIQRIPRYKLLLERMRDHSRYLVGHDKYIKNLCDALDGVEDAAKEIETNMVMAEARNKVIQVQEEIFKGKVALVSPNRFCIRMGKLGLVSISQTGKRKRKSYLCILLNDCFIYASTPDVKRLASTLKAMLPLSDIEVLDDSSPDVGKLEFQLKTAEKVLTFRTSNSSERDQWVEEIRGVIRHLKSNANIVASKMQKGQNTL